MILLIKAIRRVFSGTTEEKVELFHIFYRWANIVFVSLLLISSTRTVPPTRIVYLTLLLVVVYTFFLTVNCRKIHELLLRSPPLLLIDFLFVNMILALNGGYRSPYLLYSYAPLLVASFYFQFTGAAIGTFLHMSLYTVVLYLTGHTFSWFVKQGVLDYALADYLSIFLIGFFYAIPAKLVQLLREKQSALEKLKDQLAMTNRKLTALQEVDTMIQAEKELEDVLHMILEAIHRELDFDRILLGFVDQQKNALDGFISYGMSKEEQKIVTERFSDDDYSLTRKDNLTRYLKAGKKAFNFKNIPTSGGKIENKIAKLFMTNDFAVVPLLVQDRPVGTIWVDRAKSRLDITDDDVHLLASFATQAAVAIENARLYGEIKKLAAEEERNRLARDVHDGLAQSLSSIVYQLEIVCNQVRKTPVQAIERIKRLQELASSSLREAREYIFDLRTSNIDQFDLAANLSRYAEEFSLNTGIKTIFKTKGQTDHMAQGAGITLYWVAREALSNVFKHSKASEAEIELSGSGRSIKLTVKDNGKGCPREEFQNAPTGQFGIKGMKERMNKMGGVLKIEGEEGSGFKVIASIPRKEAVGVR